VRPARRVGAGGLFQQQRPTPDVDIDVDHDDLVIVLEAQGSTRSVADRGNACNNHLVPNAIYTQACTTS